MDPGDEELKEELDRGGAAAYDLAHHLNIMRAANVKMTVVIEGREYQVYCALIGPTNKANTNRPT